jgi:hypothetical protein
MRRISILILLSFIFEESIGNQNWEYRGTKDGITLIAAGGYEDSLGYQRMYDAFLELVVEKTKTVKRNFHILVTLDQFGLRWRRDHNWEAFISFDIQRDFDYRFIEAYHDYRLDHSFNSSRLKNFNLPSESYTRDLPEPIDFYSSFDTSNTVVGLKIIYNYGLMDSATCFDRVLALVKYGLDNLQGVKQTQERIVVGYQMGDIKMSLLTIDTSLIRSIPLIKSGFDYQKFIKPDRLESNIAFGRNVMIGSVLIVCIAIIFLAVKGFRTQ